MSNFTVIFDACVLYPAPLRDLLLSVATTDLFKARWTEKIHQEWTQNLLRSRSDISESQLQKIVALMNLAVPDCLVKNYEGLIESLELPDPDDRHVLAAAIKCQADVIVTNNLKDFPENVLENYDLEAQSPDIFLNHLFDLNSSAFCRAVHEQRQRLKNPKYTAEELLEHFYKQGLPMTVNKLKSVIDMI